MTIADLNQIEYGCSQAPPSSHFSGIGSSVMVIFNKGPRIFKKGTSLPDELSTTAERANACWLKAKHIANLAAVGGAVCQIIHYMYTIQAIQIVSELASGILVISVVLMTIQCLWELVEHGQKCRQTTTHNEIFINYGGNIPHRREIPQGVARLITETEERRIHKEKVKNFLRTTRTICNYCSVVLACLFFILGPVMSPLILPALSIIGGLCYAGTLMVDAPQDIVWALHNFFPDSPFSLERVKKTVEYTKPESRDLCY